MNIGVHERGAGARVRIGRLIVPCLAPLMSSRTPGQLLNALTVTPPPRFQWCARYTTGLTNTASSTQHIFCKAFSGSGSRPSWNRRNSCPARFHRATRPYTTDTCRRLHVLAAFPGRHVVLREIELAVVVEPRPFWPSLQRRSTAWWAPFP